MKTFVYGRPAVDGGDRGYRIFQSQGLGTEELRQLRELFSDQDPDIRRLQQEHFLPFYAYFPWTEGAWVFGKGRIETRGRLGAMYYSYLFHGVVLDQTRRELLAFNPFVLADFFDLSEERRAACPLIPDKINEKGLMLNLHNKAKALASNEALVHEVGRLAESCLFENPTRLFLPHSGRYDASFLGMFYFLLPPSLRARVSATTWAPFMVQPTRLAAVVEPPTSMPQGAVWLDGLDKGRSLLSEHLTRFARGNLEEQGPTVLVRRYEALAEDLLGRYLEATERRSALENLFRALERPSLQSLGLFPAVGAKGFPYKAQHFLAVWSHYADELQLYPELPDRLVAPLAADFRDLPEPDRSRHLPFWDQLFGALGNALVGEGLFLALGDALLCPRLIERLPAERICDVLLDRAGQGGTLPLELLRANHPKWAEFLDRLVKLLWGRYLRQCRAGNGPELHRYAAALEICHRLDPKAFAQSSQLLVDSNWLDYALPHMRKQAMWTDCMLAWGKLLEARIGKRESETQRLSRVRLAACLKAVFGASKHWPREFLRMNEWVNSNWLVAPYFNPDHRGGSRTS